MFRSEQINELAMALVKAQSEMEVAIKDSNLSHFKSKYADLKEIVRVSRPSLTKYGLSILQPINMTDDGTYILETMLLHSSGQFISSFVNIQTTKPGDQELGKSITYLRRYTYASLIGVVCNEELDHDNSSTNQNKTYSKEPKLTDIEYKKIIELINQHYEEVDHKEIYACLMDYMQVESIKDIPSGKFKQAVKFLKLD